MRITPSMGPAWSPGLPQELQHVLCASVSHLVFLSALLRANRAIGWSQRHCSTRDCRRIFPFTSVLPVQQHNYDWPRHCFNNTVFVSSPFLIGTIHSISILRNIALHFLSPRDWIGTTGSSLSIFNTTSKLYIHHTTISSPSVLGTMSDPKEHPEQENNGE